MRTNKFFLYSEFHFAVLSQTTRNVITPIQGVPNWVSRDRKSPTWKISLQFLW